MAFKIVCAKCRQIFFVKANTCINHVEKTSSEDLQKYSKAKYSTQNFDRNVNEISNSVTLTLVCNSSKMMSTDLYASSIITKNTSKPSNENSTNIKHTNVTQKFHAGWTNRNMKNVYEIHHKTRILWKAVSHLLASISIIKELKFSCIRRKMVIGPCYVSHDRKMGREKTCHLA